MTQQEKEIQEVKKAIAKKYFPTRKEHDDWMDLLWLSIDSLGDFHPEILDEAINKAILLYHDSQREKETDAIEFGEWLKLNAEPRTENGKDLWHLFKINSLKTTEEVYMLFKSTKQTTIDT